MAENHSDLFRKSTLERISSPDQLNEYIKVTNPSLISILVGIFVLLAAGGYWVFSGGIPDSVSMNGIAITSIEDSEQAIYCYVPIATSKRLSVGMDVQISPDYAPRETYGYKKGKVEIVGKEIISSDITSKFSNPQLLAPLFTNEQNTNLVEVKLSMGEWSNDAGSGITITEGSVCSVTAIVGETKPYQLMFNKE